MDNKRIKIVVIGGGASGMAAAITAARAGAEVMLFEKEERLGRKILATGNGKCNLSNTIYNGKEYNDGAEGFVIKAFEVFSPENTLKFFDDLGIMSRFESEGRVYPASEQAAAVCDALRLEIERLDNIEVIHDHWIKGIVPINKGGFFVVSHRNKRVQTDKVIVACGGSAGSQYGCCGDGHALAEALHHEVVEPKPALVQLTSKEDYFKQLKGVRAKGMVTLLVDDEAGELQEVDYERGEIQFTEFGLSGICVFNLSGRANRLMYEGRHCIIKIDLFPDIEKHELEMKIRERLAKSSHKTAEEFLNGMINKKLIPVVLKTCGVKKVTDRADKLTEEQLEKIVEMFKEWKVPVSGSKSWGEAQTTSGGVELSQINPETMESRLQKGLYFAGEVMDVDGKCGGYNLQWAWSSGIIAGMNAAKGE